MQNDLGRTLAAKEIDEAALSGFSTI